LNDRLLRRVLRVDALEVLLARRADLDKPMYRVWASASSGLNISANVCPLRTDWPSSTGTRVTRPGVSEVTST
jgi:hypothetical protein